MSRLTDLIQQIKARDPQTGLDLETEFKALSSRRAFGLNFERHRPEAVELPQRQVRRGDKVRVLPPRGSTKRGDQRLWRVNRIEGSGEAKVGHLKLIGVDEDEACTVPVDDLVVVAEFRDTIYPGLVSTGKVERGGDKPFHTVINGENFHVLEALTYTHRGKVDCIYIDPPYNTGARDWKYNNDYVDGDDIYRHSKWLAFMERRLKLARKLLNPDDSVLICTIDEKECLRLGLLLEQTFPDARIQMVSVTINPAGVSRSGSFARIDEYAFFVMFGDAAVTRVKLGDEWRFNPKDKRTTKLLWSMLNRTGTNARREDRPNLFYPIYLNADSTQIIEIGGAIPLSASRDEQRGPQGSVAVWPIRRDGSEGNWQISPESLRSAHSKGYVRVGRPRGSDTTVSYLKAGEQAKIEKGIFPVSGRRADGSVESESSLQEFIPGTAWRIPAHDSSRHGSGLLQSLLPGRRFPFPKSLYAVEDSLRFFVATKPRAVVLDFFAGSGTTAHAVMRLNRQDGGSRQCISVTNNEVGADESRSLLLRGLRPGDPDWEGQGICDYITKPRVRAAITGVAADGDVVTGNYRFVDEFPMSDGFAANAEFFTLTYETPIAVGHNRAFARVAPLLWLRAGAVGRRIDGVSTDGWEVADSYGILFDLDRAALFCQAVAKSDAVTTAFIVTDDDRRFQSVVRRLPEHVEPVRLYESYLSNFRVKLGE